jgi:polyhydroxyalkanoate synthesis regulator phasin
MSEAPRWSLRNAHYLNVEQLTDGTRVEWEHKETARETGRTVRKLFPVPMLLDPKEPADCNYPGEVIVTQRTEGAHLLRDDYVFKGEPTPEMEPLNAEAQVISDSLQAKWQHPIDTLPANGGMNEREQAFFENMMKAFTGAASAQNQVVPREQYDELKERLAKLEAAIAAQNKPAPGEHAPGRRV